MTNAEIRAELIRSATEDEYPFSEAKRDAWWEAASTAHDCDEPLGLLTQSNLRTFYLLVAESIK